MKRVILRVGALLVAAALGAACLAGCGPKAIAGQGGGASSVAAPSVAAPSSSAAPAAAESGGDNGAGALVRRDAEGLVQVRVEAGRAYIRLEPDRWDALYGDALRQAGQMFEGMETIDFSDPQLFAPIGRVEDSPIKDACVGVVPNFSDWALYDFPVPMVMLLREDGRVEALAADPFVLEYGSEGALPYLEDIEALAAGSSGEGQGGPTIYATGTDGLRYDLAHLFSLAMGGELCGTEWSGEVEAAGPEQPAMHVQLRLFEDGAARFTVTGAAGPAAEYAGGWQLVLAEGQTYRPPTLVLELALEQCSDPAIQARGDLKGAYFFELGIQDLFLNLWLNDGDALLAPGEVPREAYWLSGY